MAGLEVKLREHGDVAILGCSGHIRFGDGVDELRFAVNSQTNSCVVIDLSGVAKIDAAGVGVLVELKDRATHRNQTLELTNPTKRVRQILEMTGVYGALQISSERKTWNECRQSGRSAYRENVNARVLGSCIRRGFHATVAASMPLQTEP